MSSRIYWSLVPAENPANDACVAKAAERFVDRAAIGKRIERLRKARKLTQRQLGARLGLSQSQISEIEAGNAKLDQDHLVLLQEQFGAPVEWILFDKNPRTCRPSR